MSRGLSANQKLILDGLEKLGGPTYVGKLRWEFAERRSKIEDVKPYGPIRSGHISKSFYNSFNRAIMSLCERGEIYSCDRKLKSLDELACAHPYKSSLLHIKELREKMLPLVVSIMKKDKPVYSSDEVEMHLYSHLALDKKRSAYTRWSELQPELKSLVSEPGPLGDLALQVLVRCNQLFNIEQEPKMSLGCSLGSLMSNVSNDPNGIFSRINIFFNDYITKEDIQLGEVKSYLYNYCDFGSGGHGSIKTSMKRHLLHAEREWIEQLPGHRTGSTEFTQHGLFGFHVDISDTEYDPIMDKLINRATALGKYQFISIKTS